MATNPSPLPDTILVPLDGSPAAEAVLPAAVTLARALPATVKLLHVIERDAPERVHGERHLTGETEAGAYLRGIAARLAAEGIPVTWHVHDAPVGDVPLSIATHAAESGAGLILLGAHGGGDPRSWLTGAVAQGVIRHAAPPVLLLRTDASQGEAGFAPREITVALDFERQGEAGLPAALRLARALDVPLRLLVVVPTVETIPGDQAAAARLMPSGAAAALDVEAAAAADYLAGHRRSAHGERARGGSGERGGPRRPGADDRRPLTRAGPASWCWPRTAAPGSTPSGRAASARASSPAATGRSSSSTRSRRAASPLA